VTTIVGDVESICRYPVKSMLGENLRVATFTRAGLAGDRRYALIDSETGKVVSVKRPKRWGLMFELTAATHESRVVIALPDGTTFDIDDDELPERLSEFFGRAVTVASSPPPNAFFDEVWERDLKNGADPYFGMPSREVDGEEVIDGGFMNDNFFNFGAIHIVTTSTSRTLGALEPNVRFDPQRFRPNLVIETEADGFVENDWPGKTLTIGGVKLGVSIVVPRCVMTTLQQGDAPADREVLRAITRHNSLDPGIGARYPCVGVYADVVTEGKIRVGDSVIVE
jgi:MOSC domain-containing protein